MGKTEGTTIYANEFFEIQTIRQGTRSLVFFCVLQPQKRGICRCLSPCFALHIVLSPKSLFTFLDVAARPFFAVLREGGGHPRMHGHPLTPSYPSQRKVITKPILCIHVLLAQVPYPAVL